MRHSLRERIGTFITVQSAVILALLSLSLALPVGLIVQHLDQALVLPAFAVMFFIGAALAVMFALLMKPALSLKQLTLWDIAGGLAITGCAASVFSEPDQVTQLFEHLFERSASSQQE